MSSPSTSNNHDITNVFAKLWSENSSSPDVFAFISEHSSSSPATKAHLCLIDQSHRWKSNSEIPVEDYFKQIAEINSDPELQIKLIVNEFQCACNRKENPSVGQYLLRFPDLDKSLNPLLNSISNTPATTLPVTAVHDRKTVSYKSDVSENFGLHITDSIEVLGNDIPDKIGRHTILRILGEGGFGRVYLAEDIELHRKVAIKVPHRYRVQNVKEIQTYLSEARILAKLDHNGIVPIFDVGQNEQWPCYIVSKYIEGDDLASKIKKHMLTVTASAELVASIAETLHFAHTQGIVHRDIKPANILITKDEKPIITDFGIALREEDFGKDAPTTGTPAYMSPEQARGEGHLVDGRSDIFSLGVLFYELLTGRRPFKGSVLKRLKYTDVKPPRQIHDSIPIELERICLKALSHRTIDRYNTALDFAGDIQDYLKLSNHHSVPTPAAVRVSDSGSSIVRATSGNLSNLSSLSIIPKGLRSFGQEDAEYFLSLLPGPKDREGFPASIRFWKTRIEETDTNSTFRVGLLYGPSGCGKSSILKAGILPNLNNKIVPIYIEASASDTEYRLLRELRKHIPQLAIEEGLVESFKSIRRAHAPQYNLKYVIVIDQFEQWLHTHANNDSAELIDALRQCDGSWLQCIISVRDDFWMAITNFMEELDVSLIPGQNLAAIDLFNTRHAEKVLKAIGTAYGAVPEELTTGNKTFINKAVAELSSNNKIIPVHLALFAEMVKDKLWEPAVLRKTGGTEGVGITFLEETFSGPSANPAHRFHQEAARAVLKELLRERGSAIKGRKRSYEELLEASGYIDNPDEFKILMRILDAELKLISPVDRETRKARTGSTDPQKQYYHLSHDYLVPALDTWLTRKQRETSKGRAELLLTEQAAIWNTKREGKSLLSFWDWIKILSFTNKQFRSSSELTAEFFKKSTRHYTKVIFVWALTIILLGWWGNNLYLASKSSAIVESLKTARIQDVPAIVDQLADYRSRTTPLLQKVLRSESSSDRQKTHAALALLPLDPSQADFLYDRLLAETPENFQVICRALVNNDNSTELLTRFSEDLTDQTNSTGTRFRAGLALAQSAGNSSELPEDISQSDLQFMANYLIQDITEHPSFFITWLDSIEPIKDALYPHLKQIYSNPNDSDSTRFTAATVLAEFSASKPEQLTELLVIATPRQHRILLPLLLEMPETAKPHLLQIYNTPIPDNATTDMSREQLKKKAKAAVVLFEAGYSDSLCEGLISDESLDLRSYCENRINEVRMDSRQLLQITKTSSNPVLKTSLLRAYADITMRDALPTDLQSQIIDTASFLMEKSSAPGVHSAAELLLRNWGQQELLESIRSNKELKTVTDKRDWYINKSGQTMVILRSPISYVSGSPIIESDRDKDDEIQNTNLIERSFAISARETTMGDFITLGTKMTGSEPADLQNNWYLHPHNDRAPTNNHPVNAVNWVQAVEYCRWLSKAEGIPENEWCYPPDLKIEIGMELPEDFLDRTGYRLPTEAEWEYACRAGSREPYCFGSDPITLPEYSWNSMNAQNATQPVGLLKPNNWGMFDMHGNVKEWCHNVYLLNTIDSLDYLLNPLPESVPHPSNGQLLEFQNVARGGGYASSNGEARSANRRGDYPAKQGSLAHGFRVVRTIQ